MGEHGNTDDLALVMSGGGARAAYQAGLLGRLAREFPNLDIPILTGVSAGAINAAQLATHSGNFLDRVERLANTWRQVTVDRVFDAEAGRLFTTAAQFFLRLISGGHPSPTTRGLVDTSPLHHFLERELESEDGQLTGIQRNLDAGRLKAVAITASSYTTGKSVTWLQACSDCRIGTWQRAHRTGIDCQLSVAHIMASSALPILFPAALVDGHWYGDGGVRLTSPLSPALHLGAGRILAISTRYQKSTSEAVEKNVKGYPPVAQVAGVLLNAMFLDLFDADALQLQRINRLVESLPEEKRGSLRVVRLLVMRPSRDLGRMANEYEVNLPRAFRFLTRGLGTREMRSNDLLSLVMFQPDYLRSLLELGARDAEENMEDIREFLSGTGQRVKVAGTSLASLKPA